MKHSAEKRMVRPPSDLRTRISPRSKPVNKLPTSLASIFISCALLVLSVDAFSMTSLRSAYSSRTSIQERFSTNSRYSGLHRRETDKSPSALEAGSGQEKDDTNEWKAVLASLTLYKAAYGDVKVPQRFVVPSATPWPKPTWGLKLGKVVASIRATGKFVDSNPRRRQALDGLDFVWQARSSSSVKEKVTFNQLVDAIQAYRDNIGGGSIPANFVVPDIEAWPSTVRGLPLGSQLRKLPTKLPESARQRLESLGVLVPGDDEANPGNIDPTRVSANDLRFQNVYEALKTYKQIYGDLLVPQPFAVPEEQPWAEELWGLRLGARVNAIRSQGTFVNANPERRVMLDDLGFAWSPPKERPRKQREGDWDEPGSTSTSTTDAATVTEDSSATSMESLLGSFEFGQDFMGKREDDDASDPAPTWGLEGGRKPPFSEIANSQANKPPEDEFAPPRTLEESMEEATERALECGVIEGLTPNRRVIKGKREKSIPWFDDDFGGDFVFDDVVEALTIYKTIYGDFDNLTASEEFVVPTPEIRTGYLDESDDDDDDFYADASSRAAAAVAKFESDEEDDIEDRNVAEKPESLSDEWPEHLAAMALGNVAARIRDGSLEVKHVEERKVQLDAIDFDWGDEVRFLDVPFEKAMCAMYAYYLVRGDMFVYEDFIMPDEDPWPQALAGYELGKTVRRIRELQNFFEAYHPEKVSLLRMIDFVWFPTMAVPLDPNEPEMTNETLLLSGLGHPDYAKMIDIPMGLPDKIISDGPFFDSDDPKFWWRKWHNWDHVKDYWYQLGRRDNAYVLRKMGYPQMADEHESKYGPGLFTQMNATMEEIGAGLDNKSKDEKKVILQTLSYYRQEMLGCTDIPAPDRYQWLSDLDSEMLQIMEDADIQLEEDEDDYEEGDEDEEVEDDDEEDFIDADEDYEIVEEEFDVEDELGLSTNQ